MSAAPPERAVQTDEETRTAESLTDDLGPDGEDTLGFVLTNAKIYTCDDERPQADTLVVEDGYITHVGDLNTWERKHHLPVHDLGGRTVTPGFIDSHTHPSSVTESLWHIRLPWTTDVDELLTFIREYAQAHPVEEVPFLYFEYYPSTTFGDTSPTKELLDSAVSDRPCLCQDFSEHEHWVNSKMLDLMGVSKDTPDPVPGLEMFVRDQDGEPTGLLREQVHRHFLSTMYEKIGWAPPTDLGPDRIRTFFRFMSEHGVTALLEAVVPNEQILESISELDRKGELHTYYEGALRFRNSTDLPGVIDQVKAYRTKYASKHIGINTLKLFLDGTNESGNSAVIEPMCNHAQSHDDGEIGMDVPELTDCLLLANREGIDVHIHLVGDRAFRVACDAVEAARTHLAPTSGIWRIQVTLAHCELVDPADMHRPAELGILINWTAHWSGGYFGEGARKHLGDERWNRMYRFNEFAEHGATVTFASDVVTGYELHRADPLLGMQIAHTRIDPEYPLDPEFYPGSVRPHESARISREALLRGYTINGAKQLRLDEKIGSLAKGKVANLNVLRHDPFEVQADEIGGIEVDAVIFEGTVIAGSLSP